MSNFSVSLVIYFLLLPLSSATDFFALTVIANKRYELSDQNIILKLQETIDQLKNATELEKITGINGWRIQLYPIHHVDVGA
jgi:hypothetical protein